MSRSPATGVWRPRGTPPQVATRAALKAVTSAQDIKEFTAPQRHIVRAMHSRLSLVCVAPLGAGKWTAFRACAALANGGAVWAVPNAAVEFSRSALIADGYPAAAARVIAHEQLGELGQWHHNPPGAARADDGSDGDTAPGAMGGELPAEITTVLLSDWHLAPEPGRRLAEAVASSTPDQVWLVTSEEDRRASHWAETIAAHGGRCGYISTTPHAQTRWRLIAPWRGAMLAPESTHDVVTAELRRTVGDGHRTRFVLGAADDAGPLIARVLDDDAMREVSATIHPGDRDESAVVFWNPSPVAPLAVPEGEREVVWMSPTDDVQRAIREATATGDAFKGACAGAFVCRDAGDVLLGSVVAHHARSSDGARDAEEFWAHARAFAAELSALDAADTGGRRALYEAVARLQINRGAAGALVDWWRNVPVVADEVACGTAFEHQGRTVVRRWAGAAANRAWASENGLTANRIDAFGLEVKAPIAVVVDAGAAPTMVSDPVLLARLTRHRG